MTAPSNSWKINISPDCFISESTLAFVFEEGMEKGMEKGIIKQRVATILNCFDLGYPLFKVAEIIDMPVSEVVAILTDAGKL
jgi:hypothetical protein